jgi:hypothetical protein
MTNIDKIEDYFHRIRVMLPPKRWVLFKGKEYMVGDIELHRPMDRLQQIFTISIEVHTSMFLCPPKFVQLRINAVSMAIVSCELEDNPTFSSGGAVELEPALEYWFSRYE